MKHDSIEQDIKEGIAQTLGVTPDALPADFDTETTAQLLATSSGSLAVWRCTKRHSLPYFKIGRRIRYPLFGIIAFKAQNLCGGD